MSDATATLKAIAGPLAGKTYEFRGRVTFIVGRAPDCHARLDGDEQISRHHFLLDVDPPRVRVRDLGSRNGTYVNDQRIAGSGHDDGADSTMMPVVPQRQLRHGDRIRAGGTELLLEIAEVRRCLICGADARHGTRLDDASWMCGECASLSCDASTYGARPRCAQCGGTEGLVVVGPGRLVCEGCRVLCRADPLGHEPGAAPAIPGEIGGFVPMRVLGRGAMGAVYLALRSSDGLEVALKVMLADHSVSAPATARFLREVETLRELTHPGIVRLHAHGAVGARFYFAMEYVRGGTLAALMRRAGGRLTPGEAVPLLLGALAGLAFAHDAGIVHRDLKPENILLAPLGTEGAFTCKLADFGLAKHFEQAGLADITTGGFLAGTHAYMAREQLTDFRGVGPSADLWSLAATFYHALAGEPPRVQRRGQDPLQAILEHVVVPLRERNPLIRLPLAQTIDRALDLDPSKRWADARRFAAAIAAADGG